MPHEIQTIESARALRSGALKHNTDLQEEIATAMRVIRSNKALIKSLDRLLGEETK